MAIMSGVIQGDRDRYIVTVEFQVLD